VARISGSLATVLVYQWFIALPARPGSPARHDGRVRSGLPGPFGERPLVRGPPE